MAKKGQMARSMSRRSDGFEGQFSDVKGRGHIRRSVQGSCVRSIPTPLCFRFMNDDFESRPSALDGFFNTFRVVPMAVGQPRADEVQATGCGDLEPIRCIERIHHHRMFGGRADDEVVEVVPTAKLCLQHLAPLGGVNKDGFWLGHGTLRNRCPFKGEQCSRRMDQRRRGALTLVLLAMLIAMPFAGMASAEEDDGLRVALDVNPLDRPWLTDGNVLTLAAGLVNPTAETVDTTTDPSCGLVLSIADASGTTVVDGAQACRGQERGLSLAPGGEALQASFTVDAAELGLSTGTCFTLPRAPLQALRLTYSAPLRGLKPSCWKASACNVLRSPIRVKSSFCVGETQDPRPWSGRLRHARCTSSAPIGLLLPPVRTKLRLWRHGKSVW